MKLVQLLVFCLFTFALLGQNVGINNPDPDQSLDVVGTTELTHTSSSASPQLDLKDLGDGYSRLRFSREESISDNYWILAGRTYQANDPNSRFNIFYNGDTVVGNLMTLKGTGQMGINVGDPTDRIHVNSRAGENALRVQVNGQTKLRVLSNGGISVGVNSPNSVPQNGMYVSGNVGLGVATPAEKLAVDGDVNINGEILAAGQAGNAGQILTSNGVGAMTWENPCQFSYYQDFQYSNNAQNWTVPPGVTEIQIEAWGAGGGGARGGGGGAGGYVKTIVDVAPGDVVVVGVGKGGSGVQNGQTTNASGGITTEVVIGSTTISAGGGSGATLTSWGGGGVTNVVPGSIKHISIRGGNGKPSEFIPIYAGYSKTDLGNGGNSPLTIETGGKAEIHCGSGQATIFNEGTDGAIPGGGGGGGDQFNNRGADGYVLIRW